MFCLQLLTENLESPILKIKSHICLRWKKRLSHFPNHQRDMNMLYRKKSRFSDKDPSELTPRQLATRKYYEKNRLKLNEENLKRYHEKKK
jgi:hypothetical protein